MKKKENALGRMFYLFIYLFFPLTNVENRLLMSYLKKREKTSPRNRKERALKFCFTD